MRSAHAHAHNPEDNRTLAGELAPPIVLADIDRLLFESARVSHVGPAAPVRVWRDELSVALAVLTYAQAILSADVLMLRHCLSTGSLDHKEVLDDLPRALSSQGPSERTAGGASVQPEAGLDPDDLDPDDLDLDLDVVARADSLLSSHQQMAVIDLTEPGGVRELLDEVESQLANVTARIRDVEARLGDIRAAIIRQYRDGTVPPAECWLR